MSDAVEMTSVVIPALDEGINSTLRFEGRNS